MERICAECSQSIPVDRSNSHKAIKYKNKFYHFDCFCQLCDRKMSSKRTSPSWADAKANIQEFVDVFTREQQIILDKDDLYRWMVRQYNVSFVGKYIFTKLDSVYKGTMPGLVYAISPSELLDEWKYYWNDLYEFRKNKAIAGEAAINYDLAVLLSRNAEYRDVRRKEKIAAEIKKQQQENICVVNTEVIATPKRAGRKNTVADLYKEMEGNNNE